jgi:hypothetical protein
MKERIAFFLRTDLYERCGAETVRGSEAVIPRPVSQDLQAVRQQFSVRVWERSAPAGADGSLPSPTAVVRPDAPPSPYAQSAAGAQKTRRYSYFSSHPALLPLGTFTSL